MNPEETTAIEAYIQQHAGAQAVSILKLDKLSGGAIQENWRMDLQITGGDFDGSLEAVLRCDAPSGVKVSASRDQEFAVLDAAHEAGVKAPEPLWLGDDSVFGRAFFVMRRAHGTAAGHKIVKDNSLGGDKEKLAGEIGRQMARIHRITPPDARLAFLPIPDCHPAQRFIGQARDFLDSHREPHPALEFGLCWLELNMPEDTGLALCHRDFRTGNYMVDENGLTAILDWEFTAWSNALEDIGWFCARCWRYGEFEQEAGGIGSRQALYRGYEQESGQRINPDQVFYWEVLATARWALIAIQQGERHVSGEQPSLELALTAHIVPELELEILRMIKLDFSGGN